MAQWSGGSVQGGRWFPSWNDRSDHAAIVNSSGYRGGVRFAPVDLPAGATIVSATYTANNRGTSPGTRFYVRVADTADQAPFTSTIPATAGQAEATLSGGVFTADVTDLLTHVTGLPGWQEGNSVGFVLDLISSHNSNYFSVDGHQLAVQYVIPVQHISPATIAVPVSVGGVEFAYSLSPATVHVQVTVGAVDIIAPRAIHPATIHVPVTVGRPDVRGTGPAPALEVAGTIRVPVRVGVVLLSRTVPPPVPPIPWERLIRTQAYRDALNSRQPLTDARVEIISPNEAVIATLGGHGSSHPGVVAGTVSHRTDTPIRWQHDFTITDPTLVVRDARDILSPLSGNRMRAWWRILLPNGTWGEVLCGTTYPDWPETSDNGDATLTIRVRGSDAVAELKESRFQDAIDVGGMLAHEAIDRILDTLAPWATTALTPSDHRLAPDYIAGEPGGDPYDAIHEIADAARMEFKADRMGVLVLAPQPDANAAPVEALVEGPGSPVTEVASSLDMSNVLNSVTYASTATRDEDGNELEPVHADAAVTDPTSPLWIDRPHGRRRHKRFTTNQVITQAEAEAEAQRLLDEHQAPVEEVTIVHHARPHLDGGDVIEVQADRAGVHGMRQVAAWTLALGEQSGQRTTAFGRRGLT